MAASTNLSPEERSLRAKLAGLTSWGNTPDRTARSQHGRDAFRDSFNEKADPEHKLDPAERRKRGEALYKAHFARMALARAKARRQKKPVDATDDAPKPKGAAAKTTSDAPDALATE